MDLVEELASFSKDPFGFALWAFPWGEPGSELEHRFLEQWQIDLLNDLGDGLVTVNEAIQIARTSGHGIGKSALVAIIILWAISTFEDTRGVVTANTENQLKTKTWVELAKWHRLFIAGEMFNVTATAIFARDPVHERTWRVDMVPWSERNTEAFAGLHNQGRRILVVFDEASAIPDVIWETTEGALTDENTEIIWCAFGNPTRNTGRFRECFPGGKFAHRWRSAAVDSRTISFTNKDQIQRWVDDYGEDSDFVRIRVRGVFPRQDAVSFIPYELVVEATRRSLPEGPNPNPVLLGVDVGRFGDDPSVIYPRQGRDARSRPPTVLYGLDTMQLASRVAAEALRLAAEMVFVDVGGVGAGVYDRLRMLRIKCLPVDFGAGADNINFMDGSKYANKRAEIWGAYRNELRAGLCIPEEVPGQERTLIEESTGPTYGLNNREEIQLERKQDMRRRGVPSPNVIDALCTTFALPIQSQIRLPGVLDEPEKPTIAPDYDPFTRERIYADVQ